MKFISTESRLDNASYRNVPFITHKFLWWPVEINGETRWLEKTKIRWKIRFVRSTFRNYHEWDAWAFID